MFGLLIAAATAALPPPDYRDRLVTRAVQEADAEIAADRLEQALAFLEDFREHVFDDPRLLYEEGLVLRYLGRPEEAVGYLRRAVEADPQLTAAWYDLGEVHLQLGEEDEAREAFVAAARGSEDHPAGWAPCVKLAELAARRGDAAAFERWLREALRRGLSLRQVAENPGWVATWRRIDGDPALGPILRRLATVYGGGELLRALESPPSP